MPHATLRVLAVSTLTVTCACRAAVPIQAPSAPAAETTRSNSPWSFEVEAFAQAVRLQGGGLDLRGGSLSDEYDVELGHGSLVDPSGGLRAEARHAEGWGVLLEASYFDSGEDLEGSNRVYDPRVRHAQVELLYTTPLQARQVDFIAGIRGWRAHAVRTVRVLGVPDDNGFRSDEELWVDPVFGVRWSRPIRGPWSSTGRVDVGGFGIGSDLTWTVELGARYALDDRWSLNLEYKFQGIDFPRDEGNDSSFGYETILHGPRIGLVFGF